MKVDAQSKPQLNDDESLWQEWLQLEPMFRQDRLIHLEVKLSQESGELPDFLFVQTTDVTRDPVYGGGCADVFKGRLDGYVVALKRLRSFSNMSPEDKKANIDVSFSDALQGNGSTHISLAFCT